MKQLSSVFLLVPDDPVTQLFFHIFERSGRDIFAQEKILAKVTLDSIAQWERISTRGWEVLVPALTSPWIFPVALEIPDPPGLHCVTCTTDSP